jgi:hypothetical protein
MRVYFWTTIDETDNIIIKITQMSRLILRAIGQTVTAARAKMYRSKCLKDYSRPRHRLLIVFRPYLSCTCSRTFQNTSDKRAQLADSAHERIT